MTARRAAAWTAALLVAAGATSCRGREDVRTAERVIRAYDRALVEAHLTRSMQPLTRLTSRNEYERVEIMLVGLSTRHELLLASLESLAVRSASLDRANKRGVAVADERWSYQRVDPKTRAPKSERYETSYALRYELENVEGAWVVDRVRFEAPTQK